MVPRSRVAWVVLLIAFAAPLVFAAFTEHAWEDYFITLRASRNLVEGNGLVFTPGERLHTFTSPLGVLLPALCTWLAGPNHEELALWFFRIVSAGLIAATALLVWRRAESVGLGKFGRGVFLGLLLTDAKLLDFSTNGMETAILVFFALLLWSELEAPAGPRLGVIAVASAGLMWTRPDAFILGLALGIPHLVFRERGDGQRSIPWRALLGGAIVGGLLYLPWFAWAWWYYGSPVPNTIVAKSIVTPTVHVSTILATPWRTLTGDSILRDFFLPPYWFHGGWPQSLSWLGYGLSVVLPLLWLVRALQAVARRLSLALFVGAFYTCAIIMFPWYWPPWTALASLTVAFALDHVVRWSGASRGASVGTEDGGWRTGDRRRETGDSGLRTEDGGGQVTGDRRRETGDSGLTEDRGPTTEGGRRSTDGGILISIARVAGGLLVAVQLAMTLAVAWEMRTQEQLIEHGVRRDIGRWLKQNASPRDTVFLEPLGYIGYYSQLKMYDYPGLSSREVIAQTRAGKLRLTEVIAALHPTWLVLRPFEIADKTKPENAALNDYELVRVWNVHPALDAVGFLPGRAWLEHDAEFRVFRRKER